MPPSQTKRGAFGIISLAHLVNDIYSNFLPQLIPFLIAARGYKVSTGATLIAAFTISSSLLQPVFGYLVDQKGQRWLVFVGTLWMSFLMGLTGFISNYPLLVIVSGLAGLGTAAFHPQAAAMVGHMGGDRKGLMLGSFIAMGNMGLAISPLIFLPMFEQYGYRSSWVAMIPGILTALLLYFFAPRITTRERKVQNFSQALTALKKGAGNLKLLMLVVAIRSLVHTGLMMLLPLYLLNSRFSTELTSYLMFFTLAAGSVGGVLGGYISDKYGRKRLIVGSLILSAAFFYGFLYTEGSLSFILLASGGMTVLSSFSVTVAAAQEAIPENKAMASGLSMGFAIGMGGLAVTPVGTFADIYGIRAAIELIFLLPLAAAVLGLFLKEPKKAIAESPLGGL